MAKPRLPHLSISEIKLIGDIVVEIRQGIYRPTVADTAHLIAMIAKLTGIELIAPGNVGVHEQPQT